MSLCTVFQLGLIGYKQAYQLQTTLVQKRLEGAIDDMLLLLEHPPTITLGKSGNIDNVLISPERLSEYGISLFFSDRGGDVTYHGPGQLVVYPIIDLTKRGKDIRRYINQLEEVIILTLNDFNIESSRDESHAGVWVNEQQIAAIGLKIKRWISMHGIALNVNPDLEQISYINPCGFANRKATSISKLLAKDITVEIAAKKVLVNFARVFNVEIKQSPETLARIMA